MLKKRDKVFISYSHKDVEHLERLKVHLKPLAKEGILDYWEDSRIKGGMQWRGEIQNAIDVSKVAVLLISADFFASDFITDSELPFLLEAEKNHGASIVTIILSPSRYENDKSLSVFQSVNPVSAPISKLGFHEREEVWKLAANRIQELLHTEKHISQDPVEDLPSTQVVPGPPENPPVVFLDALPALGLFINRTEHIEEIKRLLSNETNKLVILRGFVGIGKTQLAAKVIHETNKQFDAILWITCKEEKATPDFLFSRLNIFFEQQHEQALTGIWNDSRQEMLELKISRLLQALSRGHYLLVFDRFNNWLNADLDIKHEALKEIFTAVLTYSHQSKIIIISDNRALSHTTAAEIPFGAFIERTVTGLSVQHSIEVLKLAGVQSLDEASLNGIAQYCDGNPALLQICSYLVTSRQYEVDELLLPGKMNERINSLLKKATKDLPRDAFDALALLAVVRVSLSKKYIEVLNRNFGHTIGTLLDRSLIVTGAEGEKFTVPTALRNYIIGELSAQQKQEFHSIAAAFFKEYGQQPALSNFEQAELQLEEAYHYFQINRADQAAALIFTLAPRLIEWGYIGIAEKNIEQAFAATTDNGYKAEGNFFKGSIADLRSNYSEALYFFEAALKMYKSGNDYAAVAETFFRIGRVHNSLGNFSTANTYFDASIDTCKKNQLSKGWAASLLGKAWNGQEQSADTEKINEVLALYMECIEKAKESNDAETLSGAYRQTGFLLWTKRQQKEPALINYERALLIAQQNSLKKEMAAIHSELGYMYSEWKDVENARQHCEEAIKGFQSLGVLQGLASAYLNLGKVYHDQNDFETAMMYYHQGRVIAGDIKNYGAQAWAYYCLGSALLSLGRASEAASFLSKAAELGKQYHLTETFEYAKAALQQLEQ